MHPRACDFFITCALCVMKEMIGRLKINSFTGLGLCCLDCLFRLHTGAGNLNALFNRFFTAPQQDSSHRQVAGFSLIQGKQNEQEYLKRQCRQIPGKLVHGECSRRMDWSKICYDILLTQAKDKLAYMPRSICRC